VDTVEGLLKTIDIFDECISGGKADLIFQNALQRTHEETLCVPGGHTLSWLVNFLQLVIPT
jgi:hypothetical protein